MSKHGVFVLENATDLVVPVVADSAVQVVIGTAPVNMVDGDVVNKPILANSASEAMAQLGYCDDFANYTLCQSMFATNNLFAVGPVVYINVLDPATHKTAVTETTIDVENMSATLPVFGMIRDSALTVKKDSTTLVKGTDYTLEYDNKGYLVINLIAGGGGAGATALKVAGNKLDPSAVSSSDIIGSVNPSTGAETGMEVIRQVYPTFGLVPSILLAPGWSKVSTIGIALSAKAANINGVFKAIALLDLPTSSAAVYTACKTTKESCGFTSEFCYPLWPCAKVGEYILALSAVVGALLAYTDANNDGVPSVSPSNKLAGITGICLEDGTDVVLDQDQASTVNLGGVATAINMNGWKLWGNYTGAYPASGDAKDIWLPVRRMFNWQGNTFILTYFDKVDDPMNSILIESIVDSENIRCASYAPDKWAGAYIEYLAEDNPTTDILAGKMTFRQHIAPYTPAQEINNILNYDTTTLANSLIGGE